MKTYRFVFLFAILSVLSLIARAADVTTVINAQININGEVISWEPRERSNLLYGSFTVVAYVDGVECGRSSYSDANDGNPDYPPSYYYPVIVTTDAANIGKTIEMHLIVTAPDDSDDEYGFWYGSDFANISDGEYIIQDISYSGEVTVKNGEYGSAEDESFVTLNFVSPTAVALPETIRVSVSETIDLLSLLSYTPQNASIPCSPSIEWDFGNSAEFINVVDNKLTGLADTGTRGAYLGGSFTNSSSLSMWTIVSVTDPDVCTVYASLYRDGSEYVRLSFDQDTRTAPVLSAYVDGQRVAGPVSFQRDFSQQMGGYFLLKLKDAPEGNIEFRVSNYSLGVYSSSELIVQSASLSDVTGAVSMTTFPFKKGETYGSSNNTVKVEMVSPKQVALSPSEITVPVGTPVSIKNTFEVSFLSDAGGPASIPSTYTASWNVGNYVREFTINGDELIPQTLFPDPVAVNVDITNEDFNLQLSGRVSVNVKELLKGISFAERYQNVKRGGDVNIFYSPIPESATYPDVIWEYNKKVFMLGNDPTGAPSMKVNESAPYGDYEIVAIVLDENDEETDISDTIFVTVCAPVERIDVSTKGLLMTVGQTIALSDYVKVLPEEACDREFYVMLEKQGNGILMEGEDEEGNPVITAVELGGPLTVTVVAVDNREVTAQFPVAVVTPLTGLAFQEPMQYRRPGEGVNTTLLLTPRDASGYMTTLEYDKNVFEEKSADAGLSVKANAPYGNYEIVASAKDIFGNDLKITSKLNVTICAPVSEIQVVSPITMALDEERSLASLVTVLPEEACDKEYGVRVSSGNGKVISLDSEDEEGDMIIKAVGYGTATLTVISFDNQSITAKIEVTVADILTSISFANRRQQGYPGMEINTEWSYAPANAIQPEIKFVYDKTVFEEQSLPAGAPRLVVKEGAPAGEYKIAGLAYYGDTYQEISDTIFVTVWAHVTDIETTPLNMTVGDEVELAPYIFIKPANAYNKEYSVRSSNENIVRVVPTLNNQRVSYTAVAVAEGSTTLKVISNDQSIEKELQVTVAAKVVPVTDIAIAKGHEGHTLWVGERLYLTPSFYIISPQDATNQNVEWSSSDATIVKISSEATNNGVVAEALKVGTATLTVTTKDGGKTAQMKMEVRAHVSSLSLSSQSLDLTTGVKQVLDNFVQIYPSDAYDKTVRWSSDNESVATVSYGNDGKWSVTAVSAGKAILTVASNDNAEATAKLSVTVTDPVINVTSISITKGNESHTLWVGERLELASQLYKISPEDATNQGVEWSSSDINIVKIISGVTNNGMVAEAVKPGKATLTVTTKDGGKTAQMTVEVRRHVESFTLTASSVTMNKGATLSLDGLVKDVLPSDASDKRIGWRLTQGETGLTLLENDGKWYVTADAVGSYTLTAYSVENPQLTQRLSVTVNAVVNGITATSPVQSVYPGGAIDLGYKVDSSDPVSVEWTSSAPSVVSVARGNDGKWVATALKAGSATLTVKTVPGDKTATISVTVWSHVESLSLTEQSLSLTKGQSAVLDGYVKLSPESAHDKTVRWTTSDTSVATVSESNGVWSVTAVGGGEASLKVTSVDNEKASASLTVKVTVPVTGIAIKEQFMSQTLWIGDNPLVLTSDMYVITPSDASDVSVTWSSADASVVSLSRDATGSSWTATPKTVGKTTLTVTTVDGGKSAQMTVEVKRHVESFSLIVSSLTMDKGATRSLDELVRDVLPSDASDKRIGWRLTQGETGLTLLESDGKWYVTADAVGNYTLTAYSVENPQLTQRLSVTVNAVVGGITVTSPVQSVYPGDAIDLGYKVDSNDAVSVEWTSSAPSVVSVARGNDGKWVATALKAGSATLTVKTVPGDKTATISVTVWSHVESLSLTEQILILEKGMTTVVDRYVRFLPEDVYDKRLRWTSSDESVAYLYESGGYWSVNALSKGEATLTVTSVENPEATATMIVRVIIPLESVAAVDPEQTVEVGEKVDLSCSFTPSDATDTSMTWTSSDAAVVEVSIADDDVWVAFAKSFGTAVLTGKSQDGGHTTTITVTVPYRVTEIKLTTSSISLMLSETFNPDSYVQAVLPEQATDKSLTWETSDANIVKLEGQSGAYTATAVGVGEATLTVCSNDVSKTHVIEIASIATTGWIINYLGQWQDATSLGNYASKIIDVSSFVGKNCSFTSTPATSYAFVTSYPVSGQVPSYAGSATGISRGSSFNGIIPSNASYLYILTNSGGNVRVPSDMTIETPNVTATMTVTVIEDVIPLTGLAFVSPSQAVYSGEIVDVTWTPTPANANSYSVQLKFDEKVFEYKSNVMTVRSGVAAGDYTIVAQAYDADGKEIKVSATLTVTVRTHVTGLSISDTLGDEPLSVTKGMSVVLDDYVTVIPADAYNKSMTWKSSDTSVATVSEKDGVWSVTGVALGETTLTVTSKDNLDVSATLKVRVVEGIIPVTDFTFIDNVRMTKGDVETIVFTPIPENATVDITKFSVIIADISSQGNDWRYLDVAIEEKNERIEAIISNAYTWGINSFDIYYDGKKMGSVSVNVGAAMPFAKDWTWISTPSADYAANKLNAIDLDDMGKTFDTSLQEVRGESVLLYNDAELGYFGDFEGLTSTTMYKFNFTKKPGPFIIYNINRNIVTSTIHPGWNWVAYPYEYAYTMDELTKAKVFASAEEGDRIAVQDVFVEFSDEKWSGVLTSLQPSEGFMYYRKSDSDATIAWAGYDVLGQKLSAQGQQANGRRSASAIWDYNAHAFADNMTIVATIDGVDFPEDCTVGAFVNGECRGRGEYVDGRYFITVHGMAGESVSFVLYDEQTQTYWTVLGSLSFSDKAGSVKTPLRLKTGGQTTQIVIPQAGPKLETPVFDLQGRRVVEPVKGMYIINGAKIIK